MNSGVTRLIVAGVASSFMLTAAPVVGQETAVPPPDTIDRALVGVLQAALASAESGLWLEYDLRKAPLLVYRPGRWGILVNLSEEYEDWIPYPPGWPDIDRPVQFHDGALDGLVGQLAFDYEVAERAVFAAPLFAEIPSELGERDPQLFAFLTHEAFHQYQHHAFAELNSPAAEAYPMLDARNVAMATLEMRAIEKVLRTLESGSDEDLHEAALEVVAVHAQRIEALGEEARTIERSQEVVEGTAKYVEARSVGALARWCETRPVRRPLCHHFQGEDATSWLLKEIQRRFGGETIAPRDMPRNRSYPVGATLGLLLDRFQPDWKPRVEAAGTQTGLFTLLGRAIEREDPSTDIVAELKEEHGWEQMLAAAENGVKTYVAEFEEALREFRSLPGRPIVIELPSSGFSRGRSGSDPGWILEEGQRSLREYRNYTIRGTSDDPVTLVIQNHQVLDERLPDGHRRLTLLVPGQLELLMDGESISPDAAGNRLIFEAFEMRGRGIELTTDFGGQVAIDRTISVRLDVD